MSAYLLSPFVHILHRSGVDGPAMEVLNSLTVVLRHFERHRDYGARGKGAYRIVCTRKICLWWLGQAKHVRSAGSNNFKEMVKSTIDVVDAMCALAEDKGPMPCVVTSAKVSAYWVEGLGASERTAYDVLRGYSEYYTGIGSVLSGSKSAVIGPEQFAEMALSSCTLQSVKRNLSRQADTSIFEVQKVLRNHGLADPQCTGVCYVNAYLFSSPPDLGRWPTAREIFGTKGWNYFAPVRNVAVGKWHLSAGSYTTGVLGDVPLDDVVGGIDEAEFLVGYDGVPEVGYARQQPDGSVEVAPPERVLEVIAERIELALDAGKFYNIVSAPSGFPVWDLESVHLASARVDQFGTAYVPAFAGHPDSSWNREFSVDVDCTPFGQCVRVFVVPGSSAIVNGRSACGVALEVPVVGGRCMFNVDTTYIGFVPLVIVSGESPEDLNRVLARVDRMPRTRPRAGSIRRARVDDEALALEYMRVSSRERLENYVAAPVLYSDLTVKGQLNAGVGE